MAIDEKTLGTFLAHCTTLRNTDLSELNRAEFKISIGRRYIKVLCCDPRSDFRSVFCFVDQETGDVLKPKSWRGPAKGVRGNIAGPNFGVGQYGAATPPPTGLLGVK